MQLLCYLRKLQYQICVNVGCTRAKTTCLINIILSQKPQQPNNVSSRRSFHLVCETSAGALTIQMHSFVSFLPPLPSGRPFFAYPGCFLAHRLVLRISVLGCISSVHCPLVPTTFPALRKSFSRDRLLCQWLNAHFKLCQTADSLPLREQTIHNFVTRAGEAGSTPASGW